MEERMSAERYLPMEIAETILSKLPTKSLLRFQALSKPYRATIASPRFIATHSEQSRKNPSNAFLVRPKDKGYYCLAQFEDRKLQLEKECGNVPPADDGWSDFDSMCSCGDVVLFGRTWMGLYEEYLLWNPINNTRREVSHSSRLPLWSYGLCHDPAEGDYKIVLVFNNGTYTVHSCKHDTWAAERRYLTEIISRYFYGSSGIFVEGKLYWIGMAHPVESWGVICFDPTHDALSELESPQEEGFDFDRAPFLANLRGCLCFGGDSKDVIEFWVLRGGTWEKTICIDKRSPAADYLRVCVSYKCYVIEEEETAIFTRDENYILHTLGEREYVRYRRSPLEDSEEDRPLALVLSLASFLA